jgi:hypothetical protein
LTDETIEKEWFGGMGVGFGQKFGMGFALQLEWRLCLVEAGRVFIMMEKSAFLVYLTLPPFTLRRPDHFGYMAGCLLFK